ncbi:MAG TPA: recombinase family protein [Thermomicrobiales bacterium]|jgi:DNA invertase Pin-like site-specific DNA recombinase
MARNETPQQAAIYVRAATEGHEPDALAVQGFACRGFCVDRGYVVGAEDVYREVAPGLSLDDRAELARLRRAMAAGGVAAVVATAPDRLSREASHIVDLVAEAERAGARLEFVFVGDEEFRALDDAYASVRGLAGMRKVAARGGDDGDPR